MSLSIRAKIAHQDLPRVTPWVEFLKTNSTWNLTLQPNDGRDALAHGTTPTKLEPVLRARRIVTQPRRPPVS